MNQMYERVGIKLDRSSFLFLSEVVSSSTSTPLRVFSSIDTNGYDYDESSEIEEGIISSYLRSDANELGHANIDNDDGMTEKSLSSSSHTDNSVTNSDIHTISTRCRSQSQSSGTTASIAGDAHLTRLRQVRHLLVVVLVLVLHVPLLLLHKFN